MVHREPRLRQRPLLSRKNGSRSSPDLCSLRYLLFILLSSSVRRASCDFLSDIRQVVAELKQADYPGRWWTMLLDRRIECRLCPRLCKLNEGQRGFCFVRQRVGDRMALTT